MSCICIFPQDETTAFLTPIAQILQAAGVDVFDGNTNDESYSKKIFDTIPQLDTVVFL